MTDEIAEKAFLIVASSPRSGETYLAVIKLGVRAGVLGPAFEHALRVANGHVPHGGRPRAYQSETAARDALVTAGWKVEAATARVLAAEPDQQRRDNLARALRRSVK